MQIGGNKAFFDILKEYEIHEVDNESRYKHKAVKWYQKSHMAEINGEVFSKPKPAKDWNEEVDNTKKRLKGFGKKAESDLE